MSSLTPPAGQLSPLAAFLQQGRVVLAQYRGVNGGSLAALAALAARLRLSREEVEAAASQLGLGVPHVQQILALVNPPSESGRSGGMWLLGVVAGLLFLLAAAGGVALWLTLTGQWPGGPAAVAGRPQDPSPEPPAPLKPPVVAKAEIPPPPAPPAPIPPQRLDDPDLVRAVAAAGEHFPDQKAMLDELLRADPAVRRQAWNDLLLRLRAFVPAEGGADGLTPLLAAFHAQDSADDHARMIRSGLLRMLPPHVPEVPADEATYRAAFWAVGVGAAALRQPNLPAARAAQLRQDFALLLGSTPADADDLRAAGTRAVAAYFYDGLAGVAARDPALAARQAPVLARVARGHLDAAALQPLQDRLTAALRPKAPPQVTRVETPPEVRPEPKKPEPPLRPEPEDPRVGQLVEAAQGLLAKKLPEGDDPVPVLQEAVNLAFASTLACALAGERQERFDELAAQPFRLSDYLAKVKQQREKESPAPAQPPAAQAGNEGGELANPADGGANPAPAILPPAQLLPGLTAEERTAAFARVLTAGRTATDRLQALYLLAQDKDRGPLAVHHAEAVAWYLLRIKSTQELQAALTLVPTLAADPAVLIGLADLVVEEHPRRTRVEAIVSHALGRPVSFAREKDWVGVCRRTLLRQAAEPGPTPLEPDAVQMILRDLYLAQAGVLGAPAPKETGRTATVLRELVRQGIPPPGEGAQHEARDVAAGVTAADYLADNDLQQVVLLQRAWAAALEASVRSRHPDRAAAAAAVCRDLDADLAARPDAVRQLWAAERHLLRLWLLHFRPGTVPAG